MSNQISQSGLPASARCLDCGYSLRGLTENRCPECARPFDPSDPRTYGVSGDWLLLACSGAAKPPSVGHLVGVGAVTGIWLVADSEPAGTAALLGFGNELAGGLGMGLVLLLALWMLFSYLVRGMCTVLTKDRRPRRPGEVSPRATWRWRVLPAAVLLMASVVTTHWPLRLRFALARPALEREAQRIIASGPPATSVSVGSPLNAGYVRVERRVGSYYIASARLEPEASEVELVTGEGVTSWGGFIYDPVPDLSQSRHRFHRHLKLAPSWYRFRYSK